MVVVCVECCTWPVGQVGPSAVDQYSCKQRRWLYVEQESPERPCTELRDEAHLGLGMDGLVS